MAHGNHFAETDFISQPMPDKPGGLICKTEVKILQWKSALEYYLLLHETCCCDFIIKGNWEFYNEDRNLTLLFQQLSTVLNENIDKGWTKVKDCGNHLYIQSFMLYLLNTQGHSTQNTKIMSTWHHLVQFDFFFIIPIMGSKETEESIINYLNTVSLHMLISVR